MLRFTGYRDDKKLDYCASDFHKWIGMSVGSEKPNACLLRLKVMIYYDNKKSLEWDK